MVDSMKIGSKEFKIGERTYVMGILNVTPDSFSDGGRFNDMSKAMDRVGKMIEDGADIIDVGGESTRPGYRLLSDEEEISRIVPIIKAIKERFDIPVSIDTYKSKAANAALTTNDTINRNPIPRIMPKDSNRARINPQNPDCPALTGARQMRSRASCSSPKTEVAPISSRATPITVALTLSNGLCVLSSRPCTASAPGAPSISSSWLKISPCAAWSPKTRPAMEMTISSSGAIENIV